MQRKTNRKKTHRVRETHISIELKVEYIQHSIGLIVCNVNSSMLDNEM